MNLLWIYPATGDEVEVTHVTPIIQNDATVGYEVEFINPYPDGDHFLRAKVKEFPLYEAVRQAADIAMNTMQSERSKFEYAVRLGMQLVTVNYLGLEDSLATSQATQAEMQGVIVAQASEIERLRGALETANTDKLQAIHAMLQLGNTLLNIATYPDGMEPPEDDFDSGYLSGITSMSDMAKGALKNNPLPANPE